MYVLIICWLQIWTYKFWPKTLKSGSLRAVWDKLALEASGTSEMQPRATAKGPRAAQGTIAICGKG